MRVHSSLALFASLTFAHLPEAQVAPLLVVPFDSVTLERTECYGACPAYALVIPARGTVRFVSLNSDEAGRKASQPTSSAIVERIGRVLASQQFLQLPEIEKGQPPFCSALATDQPTITVAVFRGASRIVRRYYRGCRGSDVRDTTARGYVRRLVVIADSIDAIATQAGWIRPSKCCDI